MPSLDVLLFQLDELLLGLPVEPIQEVVRAVALSAVPGELSDYEGLINCRGAAVPVWDLRKKLGLPPKALMVSDRLILLEHQSRRFAVRADRSWELYSATESQFKPVTDVSPHTQIFQSVLEYGERLAFVLDFDQCLPDSPPHREALAQP